MIDKEQIRKILENSEMFEGLAKASIDELLIIVRPITLPATKVLFRKGDIANGCYFILEGILKISIPDPETEEDILLAIAGAGDIVGEMALVDRKPRSATITMLKEGVLGHLPQTDFYKLADRDTEVYRHLLRYMSLRLRKANDRLEEQHKPLSLRLAMLMLRLADAFGEELPDGRILVRYKISQVQLARMVNAARENVNRQLSAWRREGMVERISSYYCITDRAAFEEMASGHIAEWD